jgi:hypothetical protein
VLPAADRAAGAPVRPSLGQLADVRGRPRRQASSQVTRRARRAIAHPAAA